MDPCTELRDFLRSRRAAIQPCGTVGVRHSGRRRVPGLRREEVAELAGVSPDYYLRLEQGRNTTVSVPVLNAVARVLRLTDVERAHLIRLARPADDRVPLELPERVMPGLHDMLSRIGGTPAYVVGRATGVLAWNTRAAEVFTDFARIPESERNMARIMFLTPLGAEMFPDWTAKAISVVSYLRMNRAYYPDDRELRALVAELEEKSPEFRRLRDLQRVDEKTHGRYRISGRGGPDFTLAYRGLRLPEAPRQTLIVYFPETEAPDRLHPPGARPRGG
ncbi:helix-turn-helix transcriptional regulator [Streptomonospora nanhaiensis]|uniref:helix-turn-helix transcriptional regulator n=1 Tax=Streptomonospora nanhaiensis TaxID=1323731 RepID=UPI001C38A6B2|nr:helix-turn-helix transcriptional regulator [Streptomonospora nanhaiensis]MBV2364515.1 helix-turn-helix transcriptional regulator [Streptomonospora nanhaiensis]